MSIGETKITKEEEEDIKGAFELFLNEATGTADITEVIEALSLLGYEEKNPKIFELFKKMESYQNDNNLEGITFEEFIHFLDLNLKDSQKFDNLKEIYNLLLLESSDSNANSITPNLLTKLFSELDEQISEQDIKEILKKASSNGEEITLDDFVDIMSHSTFP